MTATHVMVDDVAVKIRAQLLGLSNPGGQMAPATLSALGEHITKRSKKDAKSSLCAMVAMLLQNHRADGHSFGASCASQGR